MPNRFKIGWDLDPDMKKRLNRVFRWAGYICIALVAVALEEGGELRRSLGLSEATNEEIAPSIMYQRFITAGYRKPRSHFVSPVVMSRTYDPPDVFNNICEKREFEAALLNRIKELSPALVVLDFWYSPQSCKTGQDAQRSDSLKRAVSEVSNHIPVVIGLGSHTKAEFEMAKDPDLQEMEKLGFRARDQVLDQNANFSGQNISYGLVRVDTDTTGIPIFWNVYRSKDVLRAKGKPERLPALSFAAATLRDAQVVTILDKINRADEHPVTTFIEESDLHPVRAIDLLCGGQIPADADWRTCNPPDLRTDPRFQRLKMGQIILLCENSDLDQHNSVIGKVPGYVLQANYIEGLLDDRLFRRIPAIIELILILLGAAAIVIIFEYFPDFPKSLVALGASYLFVVIIAAICNLLAMYFGWFIAFWFPLLSIPLIEFIFTLRRQAVPTEGPEPPRAQSSGQQGNGD